MIARFVRLEPSPRECRRARRGRRSPATAHSTSTAHGSPSPAPMPTCARWIHSAHRRRYHRYYRRCSNPPTRACPSPHRARSQQGSRGGLHPRRDSPTAASFYVDGMRVIGVPKCTVTSNNTHCGEFFDVGYHLLINTAIGGPWPQQPGSSTMFPGYHRVDYVRVAQLKREPVLSDIFRIS